LPETLPNLPRGVSGTRWRLWAAAASGWAHTDPAHRSGTGDKGDDKGDGKRDTVTVPASVLVG